MSFYGLCVGGPLDDHPYLVSFVKHLIEFCEMQGLTAVPTEGDDPVFVP